MRIEYLVTIIVAIFGSQGFWAFVQSRSKKKSAATMLLLGLGYDKIIWQCNKYIHQGYISAQEYKELNTYLFEPFLDAGGDGTAKKLMKEVEKLPTEKEVAA